MPDRLSSYFNRFLMQILCLCGSTALTLTGCMVGPDFKPETAPKTQQYTPQKLPQKTRNTPQVSNAGKSQNFVFSKDLQGDWWRIFHSTQLNALLVEGLANNQDLAAAKAALREANDTLLAQAGGLLLPSVNLSSAAQRAETNPLAFGVANTSSSVFNVYNTSFQASYLLDIWGTSRRQIEAYAAQADYQRYEMLGTYLTLTTNIITTAMTISSLQAQIKATLDLISEQNKILVITKKQLQVGAVSEENVLSQETLLAQTQATLPPLQKALSQEQHALAVLLGKHTSDTAPLKLVLDAISLPKNLPISLPSRLIEQRPDIQASQALLHASNAQIGVATANLLPQITMTANYGWLSSSTSNFFSSANQTWGVAGGLLQPVFHGGQLIQQRKAAIDAFDEAKAQYEQTVLLAFKNVADALRAIQYDAAEFNEQYRAKISAFQTLQLIEKQYAAGGQTYLAVLQAEEQYQNTVLSYVKAQAMRYTDTAALYQALGGGWWNNDTMTHYKLLTFKLGSQYNSPTQPSLQLPQPSEKQDSQQ